MAQVQNMHWQICTVWQFYWFPPSVCCMQPAKKCVAGNYLQEYGKNCIVQSNSAPAEREFMKIIVHGQCANHEQPTPYAHV